MDTTTLGFAVVMMASLIVAMLAVAPLAFMLIMDRSGLQWTTQTEAPVAETPQRRAA